jgi:hypothetical protein
MNKAVLLLLLLFPPYLYGPKSGYSYRSNMLHNNVLTSLSKQSPRASSFATECNLIRAAERIAVRKLDFESHNMCAMLIVFQLVFFVYSCYWVKVLSLLWILKGSPGPGRGSIIPSWLSTAVCKLCKAADVLDPYAGPVSKTTQRLSFSCNARNRGQPVIFNCQRLPNIGRHDID